MVFFFYFNGRIRMDVLYSNENVIYFDAQKFKKLILKACHECTCRMQMSARGFISADVMHLL